jgi:hypothetical protein
VGFLRAQEPFLEPRQQPNHQISCPNPTQLVSRLGWVGFGSGDFCLNPPHPHPTTRWVLGQVWVGPPNYHPDPKLGGLGDFLQIPPAQHLGHPQGPSTKVGSGTVTNISPHILYSIPTKADKSRQKQPGTNPLKCSTITTIPCTSQSKTSSSIQPS